MEKTSAHEASFRTGSSFLLPDIIQSLGHAPEAVFAEAEVDTRLYTHPENRIGARDLGRLFECAARRTGREDIALLTVDGSKPSALGLVGELVAEGPDVDTALRNLGRLLQHNTLAGYPVTSVSEGMAMVKFELRDAYFPGAEFIQEGAIGIVTRLMQSFCGTAWRPDEVHLERRAPVDIKGFQSFFGAPIRFSATEDALLFSADWLHHRVPREQRRLEERAIEIAAAPYSELVRRQVAMSLGFTSLNAQKIATQLGISRRQLFRNLRAEGTTVKALLDEVRFARARHLLATGDASLSQIAFALGFPEHSAFTRAFVRWAGIAPGEWRRQQHDNASSRAPHAKRAQLSKSPTRRVSATIASAKP